MEDKIIKIQLYPASEKLHTAYKTIFSNPPEGYEFIMPEVSARNKFVHKIRVNKTARLIYKSFINLFKTTKFIEWSNKTPNIDGAKFVFARNSIYKGKLPWVLYILDVSYALGVYNLNIFMKNRKIIEKYLEKDNCKRIICTDEASIEIMRRYFSEKVNDKIILIKQAIAPIKYKKRSKTRDEEVRILFMGSINNQDDFYLKGGAEAIKIFECIQQDCNAMLIVRCKVPEQIKSKIKENPRIILIDEVIPYEELIKLYADSDILLFPAHSYMLMSLLESLHFGLPIIALDVYNVENYLKNNYNAFIIKKSEKVKEYYEKDYPLNIRNKKFFYDERVINDMAEKLKLLIKDRKLREKMGKNSRKLFNERHSLKDMQIQLKKTFDEVTQNAD